LSRLIIYWTMVTLGPLLLGASLSITDWLFGGITDDTTPLLATLFGVLSTLFHFAMLVALLTLLYTTLPHRAVPFRKALIGGGVAAVAVALLRFGFHLYVADFKAYQSVYGALAAIPILLFWMYLVWAATLGGAELTAVLMELTPSPPSSARRKDGGTPTS
jgi:membrane protein